MKYILFILIIPLYLYSWDWGDMFQDMTDASVEMKKKPIEKIKYLPAKLKKKYEIDYNNLSRGYLVDNVVFTIEDGNEEEIEKNSYMIINQKTFEIIKPDEYKGIKLSTLPKLLMSSELSIVSVNSHIYRQASMRVVDGITVQNGYKYFLKFIITTNIDVSQIVFNANPIDMKYTNINVIETIGRRIKQKQIGNTYKLSIKSHDFETDFQCKIDSLNYVNCLKLLSAKKEVNSVQSKLINVNESSWKSFEKGFLENDIIVTTKDGEEDELEKGTYVVFDKNRSIIMEPLEYKGIELDSPPLLSVSAEKRNIKLTTEDMIKNNKTFIRFSIESNVNITNVLFKGKLLSSKQINKNTYRTKWRRIKEKYVGNTYALHIEGNEFTEVYECKVDSMTNIQCSKKESSINF